jgi:hypothetical protein
MVSVFNLSAAVYDNLHLSDLSEGEHGVRVQVVRGCI